jgi:hypothetical protein
MHRLSYAENRDDDRRSEGTIAYISIHNASDDRQIQNPESLHGMPCGQDDRLGHRCLATVA